MASGAVQPVSTVPHEPVSLVALSHYLRTSFTNVKAEENKTKVTVNHSQALKHAHPGRSQTQQERYQSYTLVPSAPDFCAKFFVKLRDQ